MSYALARGHTMPTLLGSRAPAFIAISLPIRPHASINSVSHATPVARINHPKYVFRPRPVRIANASGAEEELFIRRHAESSRKKEEKVEEQFDFVTGQDHGKDAPKPKLSDSDVLPDLKVPPPPSPEVVRATTAPRVSTSETKKPQNSEETTTSGKKQTVRIVTPAGINGMASRLRGEVTRMISESGVAPHVRIPTGQETITAVWQVAVVFAILMLLRAGVASTLRWIHNRLNATRGLKSNIPYEASVFECMQRPLEFLSLFTVGTALAEAVSRPLAAMGLLRHIMTLRELGIIFSATWFLLRWIDRIRSRFAADKRIDKAQLDATSRIATVATFIVSLLISLDTIGINVQTVLAFGGIGGVAIGFAGREIISNFFGGFMIYVTRPFSVGEWIRSIEEAELNGTVEDIGWYLTRVRTWDKRPLYIPNSRFSTLIVENGSRMANRRILHTLHLRHEDMPVIPQIVADVEKLLMTHPELDPRQHRLSYVDSFDEFSVKLWLSCYTKSVFLYDYRRVQQDILVKVHEIIRARGAKLATRNTRDVRPGVDTDRYGPFGSAATFGEAVSGEPGMETMPVPAPTNSDVPGAPRFGVPQPVETLHTIESGVDLSKFAQPTVPNGVPVGTPARDAGTPVASPKSEKKRKHLPLSNAAVAATAAAFLAARRNAMRKEGMQKSTTASVPGQVDSSEKPVASSEVKASSSPPAGEMKITAAPPRSGSMTTGAASTIGSAEGSGGVPSESKRTEEVTSPVSPATVNSSQSGKPATEDTTLLPRPVSGTPATTAAPAGEMKITKARKPKSMSPTPMSTDDVGEPPMPETPPVQSKRSSDDVADKRPAEKRPSDEKSLVRASHSSSRPGEDSTTSPGLMKITAARPSKSSIPDSRREGDGDRNVSDATSEQLRASSSGSKEERTATKPQAGSQGAAGTATSSSGTMKITGTRPLRTTSVSPDSDRRGPSIDTNQSDKSKASLSTSSEASVSEKLSNQGKTTTVAQQQKATGESLQSSMKIGDVVPTEPEGMSEKNASNGHQPNISESNQNMPSPTSELDSGVIGG